MNKNIYNFFIVMPGINININNFNWELFNWKFYIEMNKDLKINNESNAKTHFKNFGYTEDRLYSYEQENLLKNYDWNKYLKINTDLFNNNIRDNFSAYKHYLNYGKNEGRRIYLIEKKKIKDELENFNLNIYRLFNPDLRKAKIELDNNLIDHYLKHGKNENRIHNNEQYLLWKNNDWVKYYKEHRLDNEFDAFNHYITNSKNMKLKIYSLANDSNFNLDFYNSFNNFKIENNKDGIKHLQNLKDKKLYSNEHYLIVNLFDWNKFFNENKLFIQKNYNLNFVNINDFTTYYIYNYNKIKESFNIDVKKDIDDLLNNNKKLFCSVDILIKIINYNIKNFKEENLNSLLFIQNKINNKFLLDIKLIYLPPYYDINKYNYNNNKINFTFVISSYNNEQNIHNNLISIIYQNNKNWNIIYTNDFSKDKTDKLFNEIVKDYNITGKVKYILNNTNKKQSYCKFNSYKYCKDDDIVIILDGDDWLSRNDVLSLLTNSYLKENCLALYTGYKIFIDNKIDKLVNGSDYPIEIKKSGEYRKYPSWKFTHIKTGYSNLFKNIPINYLKYENKWLDRCTDLAEYYSICEMAKEKVFHLNEICCIYNKNNSLLYQNSYYNDQSTNLRKNIENYVKNLKPLFNYLPKIFIINLKHESGLKEKLIRRFNKFNIRNYEFFDATYAKNDKIAQEKYKIYDKLYNNNKIPKLHIGVEKKHINSIGALGVILSTLNLYKHINKNTNLDHVLILEDDVYINKNFYRYYLLNKDILLNKDFIYLGFNSISSNINKLKDSCFKNELFMLPNNLGFGALYGAFSYICSRKFREKVISLGLNFFINNNLNLDLSFNYFRCINTKINTMSIFNFYALGEHIFVPDVKKSGINSERNNNYYKERNINLDNYYK